MDIESNSHVNVPKSQENVSAISLLIDEIKAASINKSEEQKLLSKYPGLIKKQGAALIHNKLNANTRQYFDSGDYNMQKTRVNMPQSQPQDPPPQPVILNPDVVINCRKRSVCNTHPHQFSHPTHSIHEKVLSSGLSIEPLHEQTDDSKV
ncbi:hypothetical protein Ciccas_010183 [Cichlidogyrus casuarinus]|uniref:Uncharacterized protein n=1 Tax=Cichlidogyrus casuarinus TaxID=1844966 RepID=A0ABD2PVY6_9PLAT